MTLKQSANCLGLLAEIQGGKTKEEKTIDFPTNIRTPPDALLLKKL